MIELIQAPAPNRIVADGNSTIIKIRSDYGQERYFRVFIYIEDQLLYDLVWSKDDQNLVEYNLRHLYLNYFEKQFTVVFSSALTRLDLMRKVRIEVKEYVTATDVESDSLILPEFYIIKSNKPQYFSDFEANITSAIGVYNPGQVAIATDYVRILDFDIGDYKIPVGGGIRIPLFLNIQTNHNLDVSLVNPEGNTVYNQTYELSSGDRGVYQLDIRASDIPQVYSSLRLYINIGTIRRYIQIQYVKNTYYPVKSFYYENNFGIFCLAHLFGKRIIEHDLKAESYIDSENKKVNYEIADSQTLEVNTGYAYFSQTRMHHAIATSLDIRMRVDDAWINSNTRYRSLFGNYEKVVSETRKLLVYEDGKYNYEDTLVFTRVNYNNEENFNQYLSVPNLNNMEVSVELGSTVQVSLEDIIDSYPYISEPEKLRFLNIPLNGLLGRNFDANTNEAVAVNTPIDLETLNYIYFNSQNANSGVLELSFQMFNGYIWSETAVLKIFLNN